MNQLHNFGKDFWKAKDKKFCKTHSTMDRCWMNEKRKLLIKTWSKSAQRNLAEGVKRIK